MWMFFAYIVAELSRERFTTFTMVSCSSPLTNFENNSSLNCQGWSPGFSMGLAWAWRCVAAFASGQGAGASAGAEQRQTLSTAVVTRHCRLALRLCSHLVS